MMTKAALFFLITFLASNDVFCQAYKQRTPTAVGQELPAVFQLGEYDDLTNTLMKGMPTLLDACNGDMEIAYNKLIGMMYKMHEHAHKTGFELNGLQVWLQFFWNPDGKLTHIGYYLKPNSRNVDDLQLRNFLGDFLKESRLPVRYSRQFTHYASFSFPLSYLPLQESQRLAKCANPDSRN